MSLRGAEFRKTDFQIHSPRDAGWDGARPEASLNALGVRTEQEILDVRKDYCRRFIAKCVSEGLQSIAITDHHEGVYAYIAIEVLKELEADGLKDFWIFPGMELTCKDSCQALIIFDANLSRTLFEKARSKLGLPADCDVSSATGVQVELLSENIEELQPLLEGDQELRGKFIILPHVKPGGHKTVLRKGFHMRFKDMPYVGGYLDQCYPHELKESDQRILEGEIPAWSSEKRGVISSSDARHSDFRLIGKHASWIKLASPTAESIRQAMLAPDSRIRHEEPKLPSVIITTLVIKGSKYLEDNTYEFNQQMNSIIGGRGAGKSTLLEYVRFALGCSALDNPESKSTAKIRLQEMLEGTLDAISGEILIKVVLDGALVKISRSMAQKNIIKVVVDGVEELSTVDAVRRLIPTQQYRQGELSDLAGIDAEKALLDLITAQASSQLGYIEDQLKKNSQSLSEALSKAVRLSAAKQSHNHNTTQVKLLKLQIEGLKKQLYTTGDNAPLAINNHDKFTGQQAAIEKVEVFLIQNKQLYEEMFTGFFKDLNQVTKDQPAFKEASELVKLFGMLGYATEEGNDQSFRSLSNGIVSWFDQQLEQLGKANAEWTPAFQEHEVEYAAQKELLSGKQDIIERIELLSQLEKEALAQREVSVREVQDLKDADNQLSSLREARQKVEVNLFEVVAEQLSEIKNASTGLARGELSSEVDLGEVKKAIFNSIDLPNLRVARLEELVESINRTNNPSSTWIEVQDEMLSLLKWKEGGAQDREMVPPTPILRKALGSVFIEKLNQNISTEGVSVVLAAVIRPRASVLHVRSGNDIEFRQASQGEQASTLLNILMNQSNGPLLIDQPEEDLDNRIINDIIRTIRLAKDERQLIIATHNANVTVNGDSENVIEMIHGKRSATGAIDETDVSLAITETMEGGRDAFELRRKKYNF